MTSPTVQSSSQNPVDVSEMPETQHGAGQESQPDTRSDSPAAEHTAGTRTQQHTQTRQTAEQADASTTETSAETSCLGCRRRKLKCSRDLPSCTHCQRLDVSCAYETKKAKPGLRPGAIEALSQRIEVLENALARGQGGQGAGALTTGNTTPAPESSPNLSSNAGIVGILAVLAQELQKLNTANATNARNNGATSAHVPNNGIAQIASPSSTASSPMTASNGRSHGHSSDRPRKRRRMVDSCGNPDIDLARPLEDLAEDPTISPGLPPPATLQAVVNAYFVAVQPWIPVLHETQFRRRMHDPEQRPQLACLLHAMVVAGARYVHQEDLPGEEIDIDTLLRLAQRSRSRVLLVAMDSLSVESLQALIILAFHDIGSGRTARAWSIVASITRTVDYLGLNTEAEDDNSLKKQQHTLLRPMNLLGPPTNWIEEEERRRVFWCVLLLDRFCSVATGWTSGLAAADVHRRLPADGFFFHKEEPVLTPYMYSGPSGVLPTDDVDRARDREVRDRERERERERDPADPPVRSPASTHVYGRNTNVGAFAYCIEAAESLSRVVSTFLRQNVDFGSRPDVSRWLTRFKELDLQLVHWKMYLPQRWRDSNVSRQPALVNMDPNLTLAHITHNTSTILLHQRIAYPDAAWWARWTTMVKVKLPSVCSAETCQNAAVETAAITSKYLRYTPKHRPLASQFAFCVYISARVLLAHGRSEVGADGLINNNSHVNGDPVDVDVLPEFWSLLRSLEDMDRRWVGSSKSEEDPTKKSISLAGHYAQHLKDLHRQCMTNPTFVVDILGYTEFEPKEKAKTLEMSTSSSTASATASNGFVEPAIQAAEAAAVSVVAEPASAPAPAPAPAPASAQAQAQAPTQLTQVHHAAIHPTLNPNPTWPMQPLDQLSPVMTYHQHAQAHAMGDTSAASAYAAASVVSVPTGHTDDLAAISHLLLDQQFMDRDRVISFEDSFFAGPGRWT